MIQTLKALCDHGVTILNIFFVLTLTFGANPNIFITLTFKLID